MEIYERTSKYTLCPHCKGEVPLDDDVATTARTTTATKFDPLAKLTRGKRNYPKYPYIDTEDFITRAKQHLELTETTAYDNLLRKTAKAIKTGVPYERVAGSKRLGSYMSQIARAMGFIRSSRINDGKKAVYVTFLKGKTPLLIKPLPPATKKEISENLEHKPENRGGRNIGMSDAVRGLLASGRITKFTIDGLSKMLPDYKRASLSVTVNALWHKGWLPNHGFAVRRLAGSNRALEYYIPAKQWVDMPRPPEKDGVEDD